MVRSQVDYVPQEIMQLTFSIKSLKNWHGTQCRPKLNPNWTQTEPKLHPETANMDFEQVITERSATLKGDLKVNLEPKCFLRRFSLKIPC